MFSKSCYNIRNKNSRKCHRILNLVPIFPMFLTLRIPAVKQYSWLMNYNITTSLSYQISESEVTFQTFSTSTKISLSSSYLSICFLVRKDYSVMCKAQRNKLSPLLWRHNSEERIQLRSVCMASHTCLATMHIQ